MGEIDRCQFCEVMWSSARCHRLRGSRRPGEARRYLKVAEESAALWSGTAWQAAALEAGAHVAKADGRPDEFTARLIEAERLFTQAGQPLDAARCLQARTKSELVS